VKLRDGFVSRRMADKTHVAKSIRRNFADKHRRSEAPWSSAGGIGSSAKRKGSSVDSELFISPCNRWIDFDDDLYLRTFVNLSWASRKGFFATYCIKWKFVCGCGCYVCAACLTYHLLRGALLRAAYQASRVLLELVISTLAWPSTTKWMGLDRNCWRRLCGANSLGPAKYAES